MSSKAKLTGAILAIGAASVFALAPAVAVAKHSHMVNCYGVNSCKGKGQCKSAHGSCKGQNTCKGQGVKRMSEKKCKRMGGTVETEEKSS